MDSIPPALIRFDQPALADLTLPDGVEMGADAVLSLRAGQISAMNMGAKTIRWWAAPADDDTDRTALAAQMAPTRDLLHLTIPLPTPDPDPPLTTRPFTSADTEAWLQVNNRAFEWHPEQANMTAAKLQSIQSEPWFDPDGFLVHDRDTPGGEPRLAGFCWTKLHHDLDPLMGEIFVVAVAPDLAGTGLGRRLTLAGLQWLHRAGAQIGGLYVESDNAAAIATYEGIGFGLDHIQRAYTQVPTHRLDRRRSDRRQQDDRRRQDDAHPSSPSPDG